MTPETAVVQALNGISFGALLFILAAGLSLIFGMMDVVNLAHGAFYMLGAYIALTVVQRTGQFWLALALAPLLIGALGLVIEPLLLRRLRGRHLDQVLLTIGVSLVIADLIGLTWGREIRSIPFPAGLDHAITIVGGDYSPQNEDFRAIVWENGQPTELPLLSGYKYSFASGINRRLISSGVTSGEMRFIFPSAPAIFPPDDFSASSAFDPSTSQRASKSKFLVLGSPFFFGNAFTFSSTANSRSAGEPARPRSNSLGAGAPPVFTSQSSLESGSAGCPVSMM